jgi:2-C-methyl-D-erythritol 2,4-cyclodiphosphate synthase
MNRVGIGYDLHRLADNRDLILGGVKIDHPMGLEGHSDADVLVHALIDALLGAANLGDIGTHFPPEDDRYRAISSLILLGKVNLLLERERWELNNADMVIIAQEPRLAPHIGVMRDNIAAALGVVQGCISIKATTSEGLGVCGRQEGIAAQAVVLIKKSAHPGPAGQEAQ